MKKPVFMIKPSPDETKDQFKARLIAFFKNQHLLNKTKNPTNMSEGGRLLNAKPFLIPKKRTKN